jgi:hypothetical protein
MRKGKLLCDVCDRGYDGLGYYRDCENMSVCLRCMAKADRIAYRDGNRWPNADDLRLVRQQLQAKRAKHAARV